MYCKNYGAVKKTDVVNTKKVYSVITNFKAETVKNLCDLKFRKIAELFYFVTFPFQHKEQGLYNQ